ncbi:MAG: enoyl-CoA hydratase/isomerase family protein [Parvibaculaceae bacterium]
MSGGLTYDAKGDGLTVSINFPDTQNALTIGAMTELTAILEQIGEDGPSSVLLRGAGSTFCSGANITEAMARPAATKTALFNLLSSLIGCDAPILVACEGSAIGAGWLLAGVADRLIITSSASFSFPELSLGIPTFLADAVLAPSMSPSLYYEAIYLGRTVRGKELSDIGAAKIYAQTELNDAIEVERSTLSALSRVALKESRAHQRGAMAEGVKRAFSAADEFELRQSKTET